MHLRWIRLTSIGNINQTQIVMSLNVSWVSFTIITSWFHSDRNLMHILSFQSIQIWFHQLNELIYHHPIGNTITWICWLNISIYHHSNCGDWLLPLSLIPSDKRISIFVQTMPLSYLLIFDHHPHFLSIDIRSSAIPSVWCRGAFFWEFYLPAIQNCYANCFATWYTSRRHQRTCQSYRSIHLSPSSTNAFFIIAGNIIFRHWIVSIGHRVMTQ